MGKGPGSVRLGPELKPNRAELGRTPPYPGADCQRPPWGKARWQTLPGKPTVRVRLG